MIGDAPRASRVAGSRPITAMSSSGDRRPTSPIVPTTVPIRSPSWSAGTLPGARRAPARRRPHRVRARDRRPAGSGASVSPATRTRDDRLACVDVDVRPDEEPRALGGPALRHDEARAPGRALGTVVEGRQEREREQQDRRPDRDRERGQAQADRRSPAPAQGQSEPEPDHDRSAPLSRPSRTMISRWA